MPTPPTTSPSTAAAPRLGVWGRVGLAALLFLAAFMVFAVVSDLSSDATYGIPVDHDATFAALTGAPWEQARAADPGMSSYVTLLERGYAIHELTFAALFGVLLAIPFRQRQRWAWWACWLLMIANLGYTATFGTHDPTTLTRSLAVDVALPVLLLAHIPAFFSRTRIPPGQAA